MKNFSLMIATPALFFILIMQVYFPMPIAEGEAHLHDEVEFIYLPFLARQRSKFDQMIFIPAGEFKMGCDQDNAYEHCFVHELPLHAVYLDDYYIDINLVTNHEYRECVLANVCPPPESPTSRTRISYHYDPIYANYPVVWVYWEAAETYCNWLGKRLPSEAEWEKAARGTDNGVFPWGDEWIDCTLANYHAGTDGYCVGDTTEVGSYPLGASFYGALDMAGNVYEWVSDWYQDDYYSVSAYNNPTGPETGSTKVLRGGSFGSSDIFNRTAWRRTCYSSSYAYGFRCAATP